MIDQHHGWNKSFKPSIIGFVISLFLSIGLWRIVVKQEYSHWLTITILAVAVLQAVFQLVFFLHLGMESKPYWNAITFVFALLVMFILVGGSIWIMNNLNYNLMPMDMQHGSF